MGAEQLSDTQNFNSMRLVAAVPKRVGSELGSDHTYEIRLDEENGRVVAFNTEEEFHPREVAVAEPQSPVETREDGVHVAFKIDELFSSTLETRRGDARLLTRGVVLALHEGELVPEDTPAVVEVETPAGVNKEEAFLNVFNKLRLPGVSFELAGMTAEAPVAALAERSATQSQEPAQALAHAA